MASSALEAMAVALAGEIGAIVWGGVPLGGSEVVWPDGDARAFLDKVRLLAPEVIYISRDSDVIAAAVSGVVHVFDPEERRYADALENGEPGDSVDSEDELSPALEKLAKQIAEDERFDGFDADELIDELGVDVDPSLYRAISWTAQRIFESGVGARLEKESRGIVRELLKHQDFDPLFVDFRDEQESRYVDEAVSGRDSRVKRMVERGLQEAAWQKGLRHTAEREVTEQAERILATVPRLVLDQVGFASRNATRDALLAPYLDSVVERRREVTGHRIASLDADQSQTMRESRYAAAAQRLVSSGATKRAAATQLRVTASTLERLLGIRIANDFEFAEDDPIVVELAPSLRD